MCSRAKAEETSAAELGPWALYIPVRAFKSPPEVACIPQPFWRFGHLKHEQQPHQSASKTTGNAATSVLRTAWLSILQALLSPTTNSI